MPSEMAGCVMISIGLVTAILAYGLEYEDLSGTEIIAIIISFAGCVVISQPSEQIFDYCWGCLAAVLYAIFGALNLLEIRELAQSVHSSVITFYFGVLSTIATSVYYTYCD